MALNEKSLMSESRQLTPRRTPLHSRSYLSATSRGFHQQSPHHYSGTGTGSVHAITQTRSIQSETSDCIYGTNISSKKVYTDLKQFVHQFQVLEPVSQNYEPIYMTQLIEMDLLETTIFSVKALHIKEFDMNLYYQFIYFPAEMIVSFDTVIKDIFHKHHIPEDLDQNQKMRKLNKKSKIMVAITDLGDIKVMRDIGPEFVNKLISFRGIVVRTSDIVPEMRIAAFKCVKCEYEVRIQLENARVSEPKSCPKCNSRDTLQIIHNFCDFTDKQFIKFQQVPEYVPQGQTPHSITVIAFDSHVDSVKPGDRVEVVGIYRAQPQKISRTKTQIQTVYKTHLDMISYVIVDQNRLKAGEKTVSFKDSDKEIFYKMAQDKDVIEKLIQSFAPSIHGHTSIKKGILAQLFGGTKRKSQRNHERHYQRNPRNIEPTRCRSDINICLVGDPSTAKSQLLQQVYKIAPRGIYTSGRGSSAVGLTANVKRDPQTKQFVLESGALVLSDLGICCIDEFDKMDNNNKIILLEGMEQQTISIAKAGIVCQLNCRTSIISAANPIHSKYNPKKSVVQNINLPPALLSRFDLIYLMLDQPQETQDTKMAIHLLNLFASHDPEKERLEAQKNIIYPRELLTKYITFARDYVFPELSTKAADRLVEAYADMRKMGASTKTITATPRQLESLIRLSEAFAKMKLSNLVEESDVEQAIDLMKIAIKQAATDPKTGRIDMDVIVTGKTSASRQKINKIASIIKQIVNANLSKYKKKTTFDSIESEVDAHFWALEKEKVNQKQVLEALRLLESEGEIVLFGDKSRPFFKSVRNAD